QFSRFNSSSVPVSIPLIHHSIRPAASPKFGGAAGGNPWHLAMSTSGRIANKAKSEPGGQVAWTTDPPGPTGPTEEIAKGRKNENAKKDRETAGRCSVCFSCFRLFRDPQILGRLRKPLVF